MLQSHLYRHLALAARWIPNFRGKVSALRTVHRWLGLTRIPLHVNARIGNPCAYSAQLDLRCSHEHYTFLLDGWEPMTTAFLADICEPSGYVLDIGANIGLISVPLAILLRTQLGRDSKSALLVIAVEPVTPNFSTLVRNVALNSLGSQILTMNLGLGDADVDAAIQVEEASANGTGTANIIPEEWAGSFETQPIHVRRIDALYHEGTLPTGCSVIKIDTDGYDLKVLHGARAFLDAERPIVFGEFCARNMAWHGDSFSDVIALAANHEYQVFARCHSKKLKFVAAQNAGADLLLVPSEKLEQVRRYLQIG